jgi:hypothetical protein
MKKREIRHYFIQAVLSCAYWSKQLKGVDDECELINSCYQQGLAVAFGKMLGMSVDQVEHLIERCTNRKKH